MKQIGLILLFLLFFLLIPRSTSAQTVNITPTPKLNELPDNSASTGGILNSFISSFDWISSGLIFNTPNLLENNITLGDGTKLSGLSQYRNIFFDISIPIFVIITSFIALSHITHDNSLQLKYFFKKLLFVVVLFILTPYILSYSIEFINLLDDKINLQHSYNIVNFLNNYISNGNFGNLFNNSGGLAGIASVAWTVLMQLLIVVISIGFFLIGFLYIVFQSIFRFIALLFLSVIFPIVLPFALAEKTENIANTFFKTWFTFLIQQPAFVLGFAIVSAILESILKAHGGNIGTLFLFTGSLIFLGGVNVFVGRIFGDGWGLVSTNLQSMIASKSITGFNSHTIQEVKRGAITGHASSIRSYAGVLIGNKVRQIARKNEVKVSQDSDHENKSSSSKTKKAESGYLPPFTRELSKAGIKAEGINKQQGTVKIQADGYSFTDPVNGLTTTYLSKDDALISGRKESELKQTKIDHLIVDHSNFNKDNPIPYGAQEKTKTYKGIKVKSYLGHISYPGHIREYLDVSEPDFNKKEIKGLLMKQYDSPGNTKTKRKTFRIYSKKPL